VLVAAACAGLLITTSALADPTGAKNSLTIPATCNDQTVMIVVNNANGQGAGTQNQNTAPFAPAHVIGSNVVFHPTVFDLDFSFTAGGETQSFTNTNAMRNPNTPVMCSIHYSQTNPDGSIFGLDGSVWGFFS
jgi:hypothetical protein